MSRNSDWKDRVRSLFGFGRRETPSPEPSVLKRPKSESKKTSKKDKKEHDDYLRYRHWTNTSYSYKGWENNKLKKGTIESGKKTPSIWMMEKESDGELHLYMTCVHPKCAAVNDFTKHAIAKDGRVSPCIVCAKCGEHEFVTLEEWTLGDRTEQKTKEDLAWEEKWKNWKSPWTKDDKGNWVRGKDTDDKGPGGLYDGNGGYAGHMGGFDF